jgi:hypothetical protein
MYGKGVKLVKCHNAANGCVKSALAGRRFSMLALCCPIVTPVVAFDAHRSIDIETAAVIPALSRQ